MGDVLWRNPDKFLHNFVLSSKAFHGQEYPWQSVTHCLITDSWKGWTEACVSPDTFWHQQEAEHTDRWVNTHTIKITVRFNLKHTNLKRMHMKWEGGKYTKYKSSEEVKHVSCRDRYSAKMKAITFTHCEMMKNNLCLCVFDSRALWVTNTFQPNQ